MRYPKEIPYISGVGADDTFILVKSWRAHSKMDPNSSSLEDHLESMVDSALSHSILTMCVTSLTTAAAFFASFISTITAIKCFRQVYYLFSICTILIQKQFLWVKEVFFFGIISRKNVTLIH